MSYFPSIGLPGQAWSGNQWEKEKMEIEGSRGPRRGRSTWPARLWGCQASVNLRPALEPQPTPLPASSGAWIHQRAMSIRPRQSPVGIWGKDSGPSGWTSLPSVQETSFSRTFHLGSRSPEKEIPKTWGKGREGRHQMKGGASRTRGIGEFTVQRG